MRKLQRFATYLCRVGTPKLLNAFWGPSCLTVLGYHRVVDIRAPTFDHYPMGIHPAVFANQMAYVAKHFNVIDLMTLHNFFKHQEPLPPRPLLITFDDGYRDNYINAYPILKANKLPAVFFLIPEWLDKPTLPWWDECAYYFHHSAQKEVTLPLLGKANISSKQQRDRVLEQLLVQLKALPEVERQALMPQLSEALELDPPSPNASLFMSWQEARELVANGHACQPHSMNHPILTRIPQEEMRWQLEASRNRIMSETGQDVIALAYPNGLTSDYNQATQNALQELGYSMAFTMTQGPILAQKASHKPFEIPRISGQRGDTLPIFILKTCGAHNLKKYLRHQLRGAKAPLALAAI